MKYLIIGAGGTGGCLGAYLTDAGHDVTLIARGEHLNAIKENGLTVNSARKGNFTVNPVSCCMTEEYHDSPDVVFICVKYYSLPECIPFLQRIIHQNTVVIPLLNVFGTGDELQPALDCTVLNGCIYIYSMIERPGVIAQPTDIFRIFFGYRRNQKRTAMQTVLQVEKDLKESGIDAFFTDDIETQTLKKFSFVSPLGAAGVYYNAYSGDFQHPGEKQDFFISLMEEVIALGKAMDITLPDSMIADNLRLLFDMEKNGRTSMQRDILNGKNSEFEGLVTRVARLSENYGLPAPCFHRVAEQFSRECT